MSEDEQQAVGLFVPCSPEELAAWETAVAVKYRLSVGQLARILLNVHAAAVERNLRGKAPDWRPDWWRE